MGEYFLPGRNIRIAPATCRCKPYRSPLPPIGGSKPVQAVERRSLFSLPSRVPTPPERGGGRVRLQHLSTDSLMEEVPLEHRRMTSWGCWTLHAASLDCHCLKLKCRLAAGGRARRSVRSGAPIRKGEIFIAVGVDVCHVSNTQRGARQVRDGRTLQSRATGFNTGKGIICALSLFDVESCFPFCTEHVILPRV